MSGSDRYLGLGVGRPAAVEVLPVRVVLPVLEAVLARQLVRPLLSVRRQLIGPTLEVKFPSKMIKYHYLNLLAELE